MSYGLLIFAENMRDGMFSDRDDVIAKATRALQGTADPRRETMTEAELEQELNSRSFGPISDRLMSVDTAREIAKKYRG